MPAFRLSVSVALIVSTVAVLTACDANQLFPKPKKAQPVSSGGANDTDGSTTMRVVNSDGVIVEGPHVEPNVLAAIHDLSKWKALTSKQRTDIAKYLDFHVPGMAFAKLETFTSGSATFEIALFAHERSGLEFSLVPGGSFRMGSPESESGHKADEVAHQVTLSRGFFASRTEVTQDAYQKIIHKSPSKFTGGNHPVETIGYSAASKFARRLQCQIPTEAQWEYLCRAGTSSAYSFGSSKSQAGEYGWFSGNSGDTTHPVAQKKPNAFGLFDVHGNVFEWTRDTKSDYETGPVTDPKSSGTTSGKSVRGGSYLTPAPTMRSAFRYDAHASDPQSIIGFRVVQLINLN